MDHQSRLTSATAVLTFTSTSCTRSPFQTLMHTIFRVIFLNQRCGKIFLLLKNLKCIHNVLRIKPRLLSTILGPFSVACPARTPFLCQTLSIPTSVFAFLEAVIFFFFFNLANYSLPFKSSISLRFYLIVCAQGHLFILLLIPSK